MITSVPQSGRKKKLILAIFQDKLIPPIERETENKLYIIHKFKPELASSQENTTKMPVIGAKSGSAAGPQQHKQPSRKGRKAWRKNVDVSEVEQGLEERNDQIIKG